MPRWIRELRPFYEAEELDRECEAIVETHLRHRHGEVRYPIATDDLHVLIERYGATIDSCADLTGHGSDVEGVTQFFPNHPPLVSISKELATEPRRENRLRTTLAHEFGHVHFHGPLYAEFFRKYGVKAAAVPTQGICKSDDILDAPRADCMEWQAGYVCGAILMPAAAMRDRLTGLLDSRITGDLPVVGSEPGHALIAAVRSAFAVSTDAARVRLLKLGILRDCARRSARRS